MNTDDGKTREMIALEKQIVLGAIICVMAKTESWEVVLDCHHAMSNVRRLAQFKKVLIDTETELGPLGKMLSGGGSSN